MTAKEKIRKWPFLREDFYKEDVDGSKIYFTRLIFTEAKSEYMVKQGAEPFNHPQAECVLVKIEMKNGDVIEF